jgi:phosphoglucomutase
MAELRGKVRGLAGKAIAGRRVALADDFGYVDPVDHSTAERQGVRIGFDDGSRIVYRLSGTGTEGATLRIYIEKFVADPARHDQDAQAVLVELIDIAARLSGVLARTGRGGPTVIT